ncbi:MAG: hypothetical protein Q4B68_03905 [Bacteroidales bacterium]|nr:hypothetical protein [Bacteroidales bacterium]
MKTKLLSLVVLLAAVLASCNMFKSKLALEVADANEECPVVIEPGMTVESFVLEDNELVITYKLSVDQYRNSIAILRTPALEKQMAAMMIQEFDDDLRRELVAAEVGMKIVLKCEDGNTKEFALNSAELQNSIQHPMTGQAVLDLQIQMMQGRLPMDVGGGMLMVEVTKQGRNLRCVTDISGSSLSIAQVKANLAHMKARDLFTDDVIEDDPLLSTALKQGCDLLYVYKSKNEPDSVLFTMTNAELRAIAND